MQYGHCVVRATATAISCFCCVVSAPSANTALSKAQNAFMTSGAFASSLFRRVRFFISCMACSLSKICRRGRADLARPEGGEADEAEEHHRPGRGFGHGNRDQPSGAGGNRRVQVERSERSVGLHLKSDD